MARRTGGAVDPTVGNAIAALGYDADLDEVQARAARAARALGSVAGFARTSNSIRAPAPSASPEASASTSAPRPRRGRRPRRRAHRRRVGTGVLVSLGGDVAVAGTAPRGRMVGGHRP